jgi:hypothetical protein
MKNLLGLLAIATMLVGSVSAAESNKYTEGSCCD